MCYHVINRDNGRMRVFHKGGDYQAFVDLVAAAYGKPATHLRTVTPGGAFRSRISEPFGCSGVPWWQGTRHSVVPVAHPLAVLKFAATCDQLTTSHHDLT